MKMKPETSDWVRAVVTISAAQTGVDNNLRLKWCDGRPADNLNTSAAVTQWLDESLTLFYSRSLLCK